MNAFLIIFIIKDRQIYYNLNDIKQMKKKGIDVSDVEVFSK